YVSQTVTDASLGDAVFQRRGSRVDQMADLLADLADRESHGRIPVEIPIDDAKIQADDIPFSHKALGRRNTVDHFVIERNTNCRREGDRAIAYLVALEGRTDPFLADQLGGDPVNFTGRDAGVNALPQFGQDLDHHAIRYTHES